ncbi:hypothetical protein Cni_G00520 [Canna indica]|uniref:Filament-like plant protein 7 n=1 Tax=Canna indica TaxID=4628 RepID=A0AAQ3JMY3_9LILI|nr:hypothetical protein Cni_G00520 [Canna indica]
MESKSWLWKRKSSEKNVEKEKTLVLEKSLEELNEQLSSIRTESNAKDDLLANQTKVAEDAIAGWEKVEVQAHSLRQQLDDVLLQKKIAEQRLVEKDLALKECTQQLRVVEEEQQIIINNASLKISREQEKTRMLEHRLAEINSRLTELVIENDNLNRILEVKEELLKKLNESKSKLEAKFTEVVSRLDSSEKLKASLNYEVCILQKELDVQNEEREFNRRSADAAHRQQLDSIRKIAKLETECQRLRLMIRKRLPGPQALAKMRTEVEVLGNNATETRRKRSSSFGEALNIKGIGLEDCYDVSSKDVASLVERLRIVQNENKFLQESLAKKSNELQASRVMFARTSSKLSQAEIQVEELSKGQASHELSKRSLKSHDLPFSSISEHDGNEDNISCAESWASALISELEHFKNGNTSSPSCKSVGISELSLMDDFVEMEKLAVITVDKHFDSSLNKLGDKDACVTTKESCTGFDSPEATIKELVSIKDLRDCNELNDENQVRHMSFENYPIWLQDILRVIVQKHHTMQKSFSAILEDVKLALSDWDDSLKANNLDSLNCSEKVQQQKHNSSYSFDGAINTGKLNSKSTTQLCNCKSNLEKPLHKLIEVVRGIMQRNSKGKFGRDVLSGDSDHASLHHNCFSGNKYVARVFLWEISELTDALQNFVVVCNDMLNQKIDVQQFADGVASTLYWIVNHCFSLKDVSDMKESIRKHMDAAGSGNDLKVVCPTKEAEKLEGQEESNITEEREKPSLSNGLYILSRMEDVELRLKDENERLKLEIVNTVSRRKDLEETLKASSTQNEALVGQLQESKENISNLQIEVAAFKEAKGQIEDLIMNQKLINEDLRTQLTVAKAESDEFCQKFSSLETELTQKSNCCKELEATCLELQLQLESGSSKGTPTFIKGLEEKQIDAQ